MAFIAVSRTLYVALFTYFSLGLGYGIEQVLADHYSLFDNIHPGVAWSWQAL